MVIPLRGEESTAISRPDKERGREESDERQVATGGGRREVAQVLNAASLSLLQFLSALMFLGVL